MESKHTSTENPDWGLTDIEALEDFVLNCKELDDLESELAVFNVFETLEISYNELRHSSVLAWLFNPAENHGLSHLVLQFFLKGVVSRNREQLNRVLPLLELELLDFSDFEIRREWESIDLAIICHNEDLPFVIAIENKILSNEHGQQLVRYAATLDRYFPDRQQVRLYLTPNGRESLDDDSWIPVTYNLILDCISQAQKKAGLALNPDVGTFINHYTAILRRYIVGGDNIEQLCRKIYAKHPKALNLIFQHRPDHFSDIRDHILAWIEAHENQGLILEYSSKSYIQFAHEAMDIIDAGGNTEWSRNSRILLFEFANRPEGLVLKLIIGPGDIQIRGALREAFLLDNQLFKTANRTLGKKWHSVWKRRILTANDVTDAMFGDIEDKLDRGLELFFSKDLPRILDHFAKHWKGLPDEG